MKNLISSRVNIMITNMDEAIGFYCGILGLDLLQRYGDHYAEIKASDMNIALHIASGKVKKGNNLSIGFGVSNFDATIEALTHKGIEFKVEEDGWIRLAHFKDPDNNHLFLAEREK